VLDLTLLGWLKILFALAAPRPAPWMAQGGTE